MYFQEVNLICCIYIKCVYGCLCDSIQPNIHTSTYLYSIYMDPSNQVYIHVCICIDIILCIGLWV